MVVVAFPARVTLVPRIFVTGWPNRVAPTTSCTGTLATDTLVLFTEALVTLTVPTGSTAPRPGMISPGRTGCGRQ